VHKVDISLKKAVKQSDVHVTLSSLGGQNALMHDRHPVDELVAQLLAAAILSEALEDIRSQ
jgi:hypothetical protein